MVKTTGAVQGKKPIYEDKEGSVRIAIFKNKNSKGTVYPVICLTALRFPFKYAQKIYISPAESEKIIELLKRLPEIKINQKEKKNDIKNS